MCMRVFFSEHIPHLCNAVVRFAGGVRDVFGVVGCLGGGEGLA